MWKYMYHYKALLNSFENKNCKKSAMLVINKQIENSITITPFNILDDASDKNNYRPVALVTAASKIFELCLSVILEDYLFTHDQQFGFKSKHSTDFCIFTVKSVSKYYTQQHSPAYTCFLDASKDFDISDSFKAT